MHMRSSRWAAAVAMAGTLWGCDVGQATFYRMALDESPLQAQELPTTCFNPPPQPGTPVDQTHNRVAVRQWVVWDGVDGEKYLETGPIDYVLGDAYPVSIAGDGIEGREEEGRYSFSARREQDSTGRDVTTEALYVFDSLGATAEGRLQLRSVCVGASCDKPSCEASLPFVGRRLQASEELGYDGGPTN